MRGQCCGYRLRKTQHGQLPGDPGHREGPQRPTRGKIGLARRGTDHGLADQIILKDQQQSQTQRATNCVCPFKLSVQSR